VAEVQAVEAVKCFDIFALIAATAYTLQGRFGKRWEVVCSAYYNNDRNVSGTSNQ
jgi:hypothetical protein